MTILRTLPRRLTAMLVAAALAPSAPVLAGGFLDTFVLVGPSPIPGELLYELRPIRQDLRCIPVPYSLNTTLDPVPNPLGADFLALADAEAAFRRAFESWNDLPTSYIDMQLVGTSRAATPFTFDTVNDVTFRSFPAGLGALAASPSVSLAVDTVLADGTDLDGDGDPDVTAGLATCADVDGDGDFERPAGFYEAGTILENDVWFNADAVRWTVADADVDATAFSADLEGVAVHEFGHSHGLAHSLINQLSPTDGTGATMYPFIDTSDPTSELAQRTLAADDAGFSSLHYPEGTAASGPAALQPGDVPFDAVYATLSGEVFHGEAEQPVVGASVSAVDRATGETVAAAYSGAARISFDSTTRGIHLLPGFDSLIHGRYTLPVPAGVHEVWIEAIDGFPVGPSSIANATFYTAPLGLLDFDEEAWNREQEAAVEAAPGHAVPLPVRPGDAVTGIDLVTNRSFAVANYGSLDAIAFGVVPAGFTYAVRVPAEQVASMAGGERFAVHSADFFTALADASVLPVFARAVLATGRVLPDGSAEVDLDPPLAEATGFVAQQLDFAPLTFRDPVGLGERIAQGIATGRIESLFLILQVPTETPFPGVSGLAPVIGIDTGFFTGMPNDVPLFGLAYVSFDGETFVPDPRFNFVFRLTLSELP